MRARLRGNEIITESRTWQNWALGYVRNAVHVRSFNMMLAMPMHRRALRVQ